MSIQIKLARSMGAKGRGMGGRGEGGGLGQFGSAHWMSVRSTARHLAVLQYFS